MYLYIYIYIFIYIHIGARTSAGQKQDPAHRRGRAAGAGESA